MKPPPLGHILTDTQFAATIADPRRIAPTFARAKEKLRRRIAENESRGVGQ